MAYVSIDNVPGTLTYRIVLAQESERDDLKSVSTVIDSPLVTVRTMAGDQALVDGLRAGLEEFRVKDRVEWFIFPGGYDTPKVLALIAEVQATL